MDKKIKFRKNVKKYVDSDYKHKLTKDDAEWLSKFEREYYDNDHSKPDSLHNEILGDNYSKKTIGYNKHGDPMTLRQAEFIRSEEMNNDIMSILGNSTMLASYEDLSEEYCEVKLEESKYSLKYNKHAEILKLLENDLIFSLSQPNADKSALIKEFTKSVINLYIEAKKQSQKQWNENYRSKKKS